MKSISLFQVDYNSRVRPFRPLLLTRIGDLSVTFWEALALASAVCLATSLGWLFFLARS